MDYIAFGFLILTGYLLYTYITRNHNYFKKRGIKNKKPTPILGNIGPVIFQKLTPAESLTALYEEFKNEK